MKKFLVEVAYTSYEVETLYISAESEERAAELAEEELAWVDNLEIVSVAELPTVD